MGSPWRAGGFGSGTGRRCVTCARLAAFSESGSAADTGCQGMRHPGRQAAPCSVGKCSDPDPWQTLTLCAALAGAALAGCGDKESPALADRDREHDTRRRRPPRPAHRGGAATGEGEVSRVRRATKPHGPGRERRRRSPGDRGRASGAALTVRAYVAALDARDGPPGLRAARSRGARRGRACPSHRGDACASLGASIGYRDPRGLPVWQHAEVARIRSVELDGSQAQVVVDHGDHVRRPRRDARSRTTSSI